MSCLSNHLLSNVSPVLQPAHPLLATLSSHPLSTRRGSQLSIFTFRPHNSSEAESADDEHSIHGDGRSRAGSMVTPWNKRRAGSIRSHSSQVFMPTLTLNGRLNVSLDQNGITSIGLHTPTSVPTFSMEKVREDMVWYGLTSLHRFPWKMELMLFTHLDVPGIIHVCPSKNTKVVVKENVHEKLLASILWFHCSSNPALEGSCLPKQQTMRKF